MAQVGLSPCPSPLLGHRIARIQPVGMGLHLGLEGLVTAPLMGMVITPGHEFDSRPLTPVQHIGLTKTRDHQLPTHTPVISLIHHRRLLNTAFSL